MNLKTKNNKINGLKKETTYVIILYLKKKEFFCVQKLYVSMKY